MDDIPQIQTRVDIEKLHAQSSSTVFDAAIFPTICYEAGTWTPNKEHERMIQSTQRKMLRLIIQTKRKRYKKIEKQESKTNEEIEETDTNDLRSTDDESGDGLSTTTHNDVDSEVLSEEDADEEIDTTSIEEEDWIEYTTRSTDGKRWKAQKFDAGTRHTKK